MKRDEWDRIEAICQAALDRPAAEREALIEARSGGDAGVAAHVRALLTELEREPDFLERPALEGAELDGLDAEEPPLPDRIGRYAIRRRIGRGGMGEVYEAIHQVADLEQRVALKVIKRGMDTDHVLQRFRLERRILAALDHPNIARLQDAGATPDGRPYFVMEYIDGRPIDRFADERRLSIRGRVELFATVCGAVEHAHHRLVVHRDLKPGNILVTADGIPKLLDFGIGKVLGPNDTFGTSVETETEARLLTPQYAAPEQLTGDAVTTATDVYSLGVLLYELLTGVHPYARAGASIGDVERAVREGNPERPSTALARTRGETGEAAEGRVRMAERRNTDPERVRRQLAGDLDNVVLKALRREPERRYQSAAALGEDLRRHLDGRPVSARPDTLRYRAGKFLRRNALAVTTTTLALFGLAGGIAANLASARRTAREVTAERDKALEVRGFLMEMFGATDGAQSVGDTVSVKGLLDLQAGRLDEMYPAEPELKAGMLDVLADAYDRLGLPRAAEPLAVRALEIRRERLAPLDPDLATSLNTLGWIKHELGQSEAAESLLGAAVGIRRALGERERLNLARSLNDLGVALNSAKRYAEAERVLEEALQTRAVALGEGHRAVGITANNLAAAYYYQGRYRDAAAAQDRAVRSLEHALGPNHQRTILALSNLAAMSLAGDEVAAADSSYRALLARQRSVQGAEHPQTAFVMASLARVLGRRARASANPDSVLDESERLLRGADTIMAARLGATHPNRAGVLEDLGAILALRDRFSEAIELQNRVVAIRMRNQGARSRATGTARAHLASLRWRSGDTTVALAEQRRAVRTLAASIGPSHPATAVARGSLCEYLVEAGRRSDEAKATCWGAVVALGGLESAERGMLPRLMLETAELERASGRWQRADSLAERAKSLGQRAARWATDRVLYDSVRSRLDRDSARSATESRDGG